jgi:hypothetical protein
MELVVSETSTVLEKLQNVFTPLKFKKLVMENWIEQLVPIIEEYKDGVFESLDINDVNSLVKIIKAKINLHEGNITEEEYNEILE